MKPEPSFLYSIHPLLKKRWSPRAFASRPVEEEKIHLLFEAARWAASAMNEQPWRFIYAVREDRGRYNQLLECLNDRNKIWAKSAPMLILTMVKTHFEKNNKPNRWAFHDLGLAIGNLTTQASALDLYVHNMAGFSIEKATELFSLPADLEPVTMIAVGYIGDHSLLPEDFRKSETEPQKRKPPEELILTSGRPEPLK
jgi:nitroreductase